MIRTRDLPVRDQPEQEDNGIGGGGSVRFNGGGWEAMIPGGKRSGN